VQICTFAVAVAVPFYKLPPQNVLMYSSPAITLLTFALGAAALHGFWLSALCVARAHTRWLSLALLGLSLYLLNYLLFLTGIIRVLPNMLGVLFPFVYLTGPALLFFIKMALDVTFRFKKIHWLHLLPFVWGWWQMRAVFGMNRNEKLVFIDWLLHPEAFIPVNAVLLGNMHIYVLLGYGVAAWLLAHRAQKSAGNESHQKIARWYRLFALLFIAVLLLDVAAKITFSSLSIPGSNAEYALALLPAIALHAVGYHALRATGGFPKIQPEAAPAAKYKTSPLDASRLELGKQALLQWMETERPYLNSNLKITDLAQQLNMPSHHLSQVLNEAIQLNFNDFINTYRISEAQRRLKDERYRHLSIEALGMDCGFANKTTFNRAFKKIAGTTPGEFLKKNTV